MGRMQQLVSVHVIVGGKLLALGQKRKSFGSSGGGNIKLCPRVHTTDVEHVRCNDKNNFVRTIARYS